MSGSPYRANRCVAVASRMFSLAMRWGWIAANPCRGVEKFTEHRRERYLTEAELGALLSALDGHPDQQGAHVIRLLVLTGARKGEVLAAKWGQVDFAAGLWIKPAATTKTNKIYRAELNEEAIALLTEIRAAAHNSPFVFPGDGNTGHLVDVKKTWRAVCKAAGITGLRIHDLRHSFASFALNAGESLATIGAQLGHTQPSTTARYSHIFAEAQRRATAKVGKVFANAKGKGAKVVNISGRSP